MRMDVVKKGLLVNSSLLYETKGYRGAISSNTSNIETSKRCRSRYIEKYSHFFVVIFHVSPQAFPTSVFFLYAKKHFEAPGCASLSRFLSLTRVFFLLYVHSDVFLLHESLNRSHYFSTEITLYFYFYLRK